MKVVCLIADIVGSRELPDRKATQERLRTVIERINDESKLHLLSPYTITLGDEFQAVYSDFSSLFTDIIHILFACYPVQIRFSIGSGALLTEINRNQALGMDGPAFYSARESLNELKNRKKSVLMLSGENSPVFEIAGHYVNLLSKQIDRWNKTSLGCLYHLLKGIPRKNIPEAVRDDTGVKDRMVYKAIASNDLEELRNALVRITGILNGCRQ